MATELIITLETLETLTPSVVYNGGLDTVLTAIDKEVRATVTDATTEKGRKEIRSLAYKVARSKTFIDKLGKKCGEDAKKIIDGINADRKKAESFLQKLQDEISKPADDFDIAEENRITALQTGLQKINDSVLFSGVTTTANIIERGIELDALFNHVEWQEYAERAMLAYNSATQNLRNMHQAAKAHEDQEAELIILRAESEKRKQEELLSLPIMNPNSSNLILDNPDTPIITTVPIQIYSNSNALAADQEPAFNTNDKTYAALVAANFPPSYAMFLIKGIRSGKITCLKIVE